MCIYIYTSKQVLSEYSRLNGDERDSKIKQCSCYTRTYKTNQKTAFLYNLKVPRHCYYGV